MDDRDESRPATSRKIDADFEPGVRVEFVPDGMTGTVQVSAGGFSHVIWDDEKDLGGSRVANEKLRRAREA